MDAARSEHSKRHPTSLSCCYHRADINNHRRYFFYRYEFKYSDNFPDAASSGHNQFANDLLANWLTQHLIDLNYGLCIWTLALSLLVRKLPHGLRSEGCTSETTLFQRQGAGEKRRIKSGDAPKPTLAGKSAGQGLIQQAQ